MTVLVPYVIEKSGREERAMDIYSRLLKDRIVILGQPGERRCGQQPRRPDAVPPVRGCEGRHSHVHQLPRRLDHGRDGHLRHHAIHHLRRHTYCIGQAASMGAVLLTAGATGKRNAPAQQPDHDPPAPRRDGRHGGGSGNPRQGSPPRQSPHERNSAKAHRPDAWTKSTRTPTAIISSWPRKPATTA